MKPLLAIRSERLRCRAGMTLLEVVVASVILSLLVAIALDGIFFAQKTLTWSSFQADLEQRANAELGRITNEMAAAANVLVSTDGRTVLYQIPIDYPPSPDGNDYDGDGTADPDGDYVDASGAIEYGYHTLGATTVGTEPLGWSVVLQFVANGEVLSEVVDQLDYNRDQDFLDSFILGRVDVAVLDAAETAAFIAAGADSFDITTATVENYQKGVEGLIQRSDLTTDINQDGTNDPIFSLVDLNGVPSAAGNRLVATVWLSGKDPDGHAKIRDVTTTIDLRNRN